MRRSRKDLWCSRVSSAAGRTADRSGGASVFPTIETKRLVLRMPTPREARTMLAYYTQNREHLEPWSPRWPDAFYTLEHWRNRLRQYREEFRADRSCRLSLFARERARGHVLGHITLSEITRGPFQACFLGYSLDCGVLGRGLMTEALRATIAYAFDALRLHRIMANYLPTNERSARVLRRLGFSVDGYSRDYLLIDGEWRDHVLTSLTNPQWRERRSPGLSRK